MKKLTLLLLFLFISLNTQAQFIAFVSSNRTGPFETTVYGKPVLSNFHIDNAQPSRVYYDVVGDETGLTTTGFTISGKVIDSINTTSNYFIVNSAFTFWDNNTIRYEGVETVIYNFTLTYITNDITEPTADTYRYVTTAAVGGGNGLTEGTSWTPTEAITNMVAGMTIWFKAGNYGDIKTDFTEVGLVDSPVKWIGYKNTIGDIVTNYYDNGVTYDTSEMPSFSNVGGTYYTFRFKDSQYIIFKNFQFSGGNCNLDWLNTSVFDHAVLENINILPSLRPTGIVFFNDNTTTNLHQIRLKGCVVMTQSLNNILLRGAGFNMIENCKSYSTQTTASPDYMLGVGGSNNIIKDCYIEATVQPDSSIHGIYVRSVNWANSDFNLIVGNTAKNTFYGIDIRNTGTNNNIAKNNNIIGNGATQTGGLCINGAGSNNIFESNKVTNVRQGILIREDEAEGSDLVGIGTGNIFRNNIISGVSEGAIYTSGNTGNTVAFDDVKIYNNTFDNCAYFNSEGNIVALTNFDVKNNIFNSVSGNGFSGGSASNFNFDYNNFYLSWVAGIGTNDVNINPLLDVNFVPSGLLQLVPKLTNYDYNGKQRDGISTIGAVTMASESVGSIGNYLPDYYVSSTDGSDLNDGLTSETAWQTLDKFDNGIYPENTVIALKRGNTFTGQIYRESKTTSLVITAYGTGEKPIINDVQAVAIDFYYSSNITLDNLDIRNATYTCVRLSGSSNVTFTNCNIGQDANKAILTQFDVSDCSNIIIDGCLFDSYYNTLDSNGIGGSIDAITFTSTNGGEIKNSIFYNWGHTSISLTPSVGREIKNVKVYNNEMYLRSNMTYGGSITTDRLAYNNEIYNNIFDGTKSVQLNGYSNHFHHNIVKNTKVSAYGSYNEGMGVAFQNYAGTCYDNVVENNLFENCSSTGVEFMGSNSGNVTTNIVRNNIMYNCGLDNSNYGISFITDGTFNDGNIIQNNLVFSDLSTNTVMYYGSPMSVTTFNSQTSHNHTIADNLSSDPLFVSANDYHLTSSSPTIGTGIAALSTLDYEGNTIPFQTTDIGLYESAFADSAPPIIVTAPVLTIGTVTPTSVQFTWTASTSTEGTISSYWLYKDGAGKPSTPYDQVNATPTSYTATYQITAGVETTFELVAKDNAGNTSDYSNILTVTPN